MGMERLTNAFGLLTMVRGICSVAGAPLTGKLPSLLRMRAQLHACACNCLHAGVHSSPSIW